MRLILVSLGVAVLSACSFSETPELGALSLSASEVQAGGVVTGTATVEDDDGDLNGGKMLVKLSAAAGVVDSRELPIALGDDASKAAVSLSLQIAPSAPKGAATVELVVVDKAGHSSNAQTATLTIK